MQWVKDDGGQWTVKCDGCLQLTDVTLAVVVVLKDHVAAAGINVNSRFLQTTGTKRGISRSH